jgi:hypothetical protein
MIQRVVVVITLIAVVSVMAAPMMAKPGYAATYRLRVNNNSGALTGVLAAGADEVSAAVAALFGAHAQAYQSISAQAAAFHNQFVQALQSGSGSYASNVGMKSMNRIR